MYQQIVTGSGRNNNRAGNSDGGSDGDSPEAGDWTRSGGPLMRTTSAQMFTDYVQNLDAVDPDQTTIRGSDRGSESDLNAAASSSSSRSITVTEGDYLQTGRTHNGFVLNLVRGQSLRRNQDLEERQNVGEAPECVQLDSPENNIDGGSSASEDGDAQVEKATETGLMHE